MITKAERLLLLAQAIADETPNFFVAIGAGPEICAPMHS